MSVTMQRNSCLYALTFLVTCAVILIFSKGDSNPDTEERWTISDDETVTRQKKDTDGINTDTDEVIPFEELYARSFEHFVDPLGYETEAKNHDVIHQNEAVNKNEAAEDKDSSNSITYEELHHRTFKSFVDSLGYEDKQSNTSAQEDENVKGASNSRQELRRRRAATGSDPFSVIAAISGGSVIHTDKENISSAIDVLTSATLPSPVLISRWSIVVSSNWTGTVYVDQSVYNLAVEVQTSCCDPILNIFDPTGRMVQPSDPNVTITVNTSTLHHIRIGQPIVGTWTLRVDDNRNQTYDINARGSSSVDFDASSVDVNGNPISGQPEAGSNSTYMKIQPNGGSAVSNWTYFVVQAKNGTILQSIPMGRPKGSRTLRWYIVPVIWPNLDVYIGVQGLDKDGHMFTREQTTMVLPSGVRLVLINPDKEYISSCTTPNVLRYQVRNVGQSANFTSTVLIDTSNFEASINPSRFHLSNVLTFQTLNCTVLLKPRLFHNTVANVNLQIIADDGRTQYLQHNLITSDLDCRTPGTSTSNPRSSASYHISSIFANLIILFVGFSIS